MFYFSVDPRDGGFGAAGVCNTCCCQQVTMRPNETAKWTINYAPWSVPIGGHGLIQNGTEIDISINSAGCSTAQIDGFGQPNLGATGYSIFPTPISTDLVSNVAINGTAPAGNSFTYRVVPLTGPRQGAITLFNPNTGAFTYRPNAGYTGYDDFFVEMTDAQNRKLVRRIGITVGNPTLAAPSEGNRPLLVDRTKIVINSRMHTLAFPVIMQPTAQQCEVYTLSVRQQARDCSDIYTHISCFDVHVGKC